MYKIVFVRRDGKIQKFESVPKIHYGETSKQLSPIEDCEILTKFFLPQGYFQFVCDDFTVSYHDENTTHVTITKT